MEKIFKSYCENCQKETYTCPQCGGCYDCQGGRIEETGLCIRCDQELSMKNATAHFLAGDEEDFDRQLFDGIDDRVSEKCKKKKK